VLEGNFVARYRFTAGKKIGIISQRTTWNKDGNSSDADNNADAYYDY
jgi:hypothetical protein